MAEGRTTPQWLNEQIGQELGYTGTFGTGNFQTWLDANPQVKAQYNQKFSAATQGTFENRALGQSGQDQDILQYTQNQVQNPTLPSGGEQAPVIQNVQQNELMSATASKLDPNAQAVTAPAAVATPQIQATQAAAATVDPNQVTQTLGTDTGKIEAITTAGKEIPQAVAQQGVVSDQSTVAGQLTKLYNEIDETGKPAWARGAINSAEEKLAARGLAASSIAASAITAAVQQAALPIAAQDAATYFQMDLTNLNNRQQTELENVRIRQQNMLTDVAIENAAAQFNASNDIQKEQFVTSLVSQIAEQNANRVNATNQFNASQVNAIAAQNANNEIDVAKFNEQMKSQVEQFNATLSNDREKFNSTMQFAVEQSNALWRRTINTQNTAAINAANATNVQNMFNMSQTSLNNLWQMWRDEASWAFSASESDKNRYFNAAMAANQRDFAEDQDNQEMYMAAGMFAANLWANS